MENSTANKKNLIRKRPDLARIRRAHKEYTLTHKEYTLTHKCTHSSTNEHTQAYVGH